MITRKLKNERLRERDREREWRGKTERKNPNRIGETERG